MKTLTYECGSLGEAITRIRYSNDISMLDMHRACRVTIEINTESPVDPSYLHIGGPISFIQDNNEKKKTSNTDEPLRKPPKSQRTIGFLREPVKEETKN